MTAERPRHVMSPRARTCNACGTMAHYDGDPFKCFACDAIGDAREVAPDPECTMCGYPRSLHDDCEHEPCLVCVGPGTYADETEATRG